MYEKMRSAVMLEMAKNGIDSEMMKTFLNIIDKVAEKFVISEQCTDLVLSVVEINWKNAETYILSAKRSKDVPMIR